MAGGGEIPDPYIITFSVNLCQALSQITGTPFADAGFPHERGVLLSNLPRLVLSSFGAVSNFISLEFADNNLRRSEYNFQNCSAQLSAKEYMAAPTALRLLAMLLFDDS